MIQQPPFAPTGAAVLSVDAEEDDEEGDDAEVEEPNDGKGLPVFAPGFKIKPPRSVATVLSNRFTSVSKIVFTSTYTLSTGRSLFNALTRPSAA